MSEKELSLAELRREYRLRALRKYEVDPDPFRQFGRWFEEALAAAVPDPNAMVLATADGGGRPSARVVLLKSFSIRGFVFFTNYISRKALALKENPQATLLFFWSELERQIRVEGRAEKTSDEESDEYFRTRPIGSRISAWASRQSAVVPNRETLEACFEQERRRFADEGIGRPPFWGGYRVVPDCFEFWQGRAERLHDRIQYRLSAEGAWIIERLCP